jgi:hypothetical protein
MPTLTWVYFCNMNICKLLEEQILQYEMPSISCAFYIMYFCVAYMMMRQLL